MHREHKPTWLTGAREIVPFSSLSDVSTGAVVAARSAVAGVKLLTKNPSEAVLALAEEGALQVRIAHEFRRFQRNNIREKGERKKLVKLK